MLKYKKNLTLSQGGIDIGLKVGILAEIGYMLYECAVYQFVFDVCHGVTNIFCISTNALNLNVVMV